MSGRKERVWRGLFRPQDQSEADKGTEMKELGISSKVVETRSLALGTDCLETYCLVGVSVCLH